MLEQDKAFIEGLNGEIPAILVAYGLATCEPGIRRMLKTHARRYQHGSYEPHQHALAVATGWKHAMLAPAGTSADGSENHRQYGVTGRLDLVYMVGTALTVLMVRYRAQQPNTTITRPQMQAVEDAMSNALIAYGVPRELWDVAWPTHEARLNAMVAELTTDDGDEGDVADGFWDLVQKLNLGDDTVRQVMSAFETLTPPHIAGQFEESFRRYFHELANTEEEFAA